MFAQSMPPLIDIDWAHITNGLVYLLKRVNNVGLKNAGVCPLSNDLCVCTILLGFVGESRGLLLCRVTIGVDLVGIWGERMTSAEGGVGYGEGCPFRSQPGGLGSVVSSPSGVQGRAPAENGFWRILKATGRFFLYLCDKI